ncbi:MAG: heparan-alpha-glucosaminide N-acetyltransferase domain-containing protein [Candidatus Kapaibacterium sp.]
MADPSVCPNFAPQQQSRNTGRFLVHSTTQHPSDRTPSASTRLTMLDAVKVFAMVMMMQGHTLDALARPDQLDINVFPWVLWFHIRGATAPIFLTVSGILFAVTLRRTASGTMDPDQASKRVRWAGILMLIGYLLVFPASNVLDLPDVRPEGWRLFFQANILQLNAVALSLVTAIALVVRENRRTMIAFFMLGGVILLVTPWVNHSPWFSVVPEFIGAFLSYEHGSYFPVFPYASYMLFGAGLGALLRDVPRDARREALRAMAWKSGLLVGAAGLVSLLVEPRVIPFYDALNLLQSFPSVVLLREAGVMMVIALFAGLRIRGEKTRRTVELWGRQSLTIYVVHLLVLFGPPWITSIGHWYPKSLSLGISALIAVGVITSTLGIVWYQEQLRTARPQLYARLRTALLLLLTYAVLGWGRIPFIK